jgi:glycine cleavage system regulatory protein
MKTHLIVTITCPDRPGIVEQITEVLVRFSGNWEESHFARLGGDFAGIVRISAAADNADALAAALTALRSDQMTVTVKKGQPPAAGEPAGHTLGELKLSGADHEGIVHSVAAFLASRQINVETMETEVVLAPISATPLFHMEARIKIPPGTSLPDLDTALQQIGEELGVDIALSSAAD